MLERMGLINNLAEFSRSAKQLKRALRDLFLELVRNYRCLVESNVPTLQGHFKLNSKPSSAVFLLLGPSGEPRFDLPL